MKKYFIFLAFLLFLSAPSFATWITQETDATGFILYDVQAATERIVYCCGNNGTFGISTDRGVTWTFSTVGGTADTYYSLCFLNSQEGWIAGVNNIDPSVPTPEVFYTSNGATSWTRRSPTVYESTTGTTLRDIFFLNSNTGWTCGRGGTADTNRSNFYYTTNGGANWTTAEVGAITLTSLYFKDANNGWMTENVGSDGNVWKTSNGGLTWTSQSFGGCPLTSLSYQSVSGSDYLWAAGGAYAIGRIRATTNGGTTWDNTAPGTGQLLGIHFLNQNNGWAVGNSGAVLYTSNGGANWTTQEALTPFNINNVHYYNTANSWYVTGNATGGRRIYKDITNPTITSVTPSNGYPGQTLDVTLAGTNLQSNSMLTFSGNGVTVNSLTVTGNSSTAATANITVFGALGNRNATYSNEDTGSGSLTNAFEVVSTTTTTTTTTTTITPTTTTTTPSTSGTSTTTTSTTTTTSATSPRITSAAPSGPQILSDKASKQMSATILGENFRTGATVKMTKSGQADVSGQNVVISTDGKTITASFDLPASGTNPSAIGYWNLQYSDGISTTTLNKAFLLEGGGVYFYPNSWSAATMASAAGGSNARIAYILSSNSTVSIVIYDVRSTRVIYHRTYASGSTGGTVGYNEISWDGTTDLGPAVTNGVYIMQVLANGSPVGSTSFVVNK